MLNARGLVGGCMCEWSMEVNAASTGDVYGKQASKTPHDAAFLKQCNW
jgi:hypothetical protein